MARIIYNQYLFSFFMSFGIRPQQVVVLLSDKVVILFDRANFVRQLKPLFNKIQGVPTRCF